MIEHKWPYSKTYGDRLAEISRTIKAYLLNYDAVKLHLEGAVWYLMLWLYDTVSAVGKTQNYIQQQMAVRPTEVAIKNVAGYCPSHKT
jgi:hypothetical protein